MKSIIFILLIMLSSSIIYAQNDLDSCLVSFYEFNTNAITDSRGTNNGSLVGGAYGTDRFGATSEALKMSGVGMGDIAEVAHTIVDPNNDFGIAFWVNIDSLNTTDGDQYLVTSRHNATGGEEGGVDISVNTLGEVTCVIRTLPIASIVNITSSGITANRWHHIVVTRDNNTLLMYIDDVLEASSAITPITTPIPSYWTFGAIYNPGPIVFRELSGRLDEVRFYCRTLTPTDVTTLYADQLCVAADYNFDNSNAVDVQGGNNGVILGTSFGTDRMGVANKALQVGGAGSDQLVEVPFALIDPAEDFTISFWTNINSFSTPDGLQYLVTSRHDALGNERGGVDLAVNTAGEVTCDMRNAIPTSLASIKSAPLTAGVWHHIVVRRTNNTLELYIDNVLNSSGGIAGGAPAVNFWTFGGIYNPGPTIVRELNGRLDDIHFYCNAISLPKITSVYLPVEEIATPTVVASIYPNPVKEVLQIEVKGTDQVLQAQVMNLQGQVVQTTTIQHNSTLNVQELPSGIYFLQLSDGQRLVETKKFIKR